MVEHERAHAAARENLKRLLLRASPDPLALLAAGQRLRADFEDAAETAADRAACARVPPLQLARALLKVAALAPRGPILGIAAAAWHGDLGLAARVRALVLAHDCGPSFGAPPRPLRGAWLAAGGLAAFLTVTGCVLLPRVHGMLESLVRLLS